MNRSSWQRAVFLLIPVLALLAVATKGYWLQQHGVERVFAVEGFDPRDLLAGHYLTYRLVYGAEDPCSHPMPEVPIYFCADNNTFQFGDPRHGWCSLQVAGRCEHGRFVAGLERFYIPEERAFELETAIRGHRGEIVVSIMPNTGQARVKDLLLDGRSWHENKP